MVNGKWRATGFFGNNPDSPKHIHSLLWHSLELDPSGNGVSAGGMTFTNVVVDVPEIAFQTEAEPGESDAPDANPTDLYGALARVASAEDKAAYVAILTVHPGASGATGLVATRILDERYAPLLIGKLERGDLIATAYRSGANDREELAPPDWQNVAIRPEIGRMVYDGEEGQWFWSAVEIEVPSDEGSLEDAGPLQACITLFEELDEQLPDADSKKAFFRAARMRIDPSLSDYVLKKAWREASLKEIRRRPGLRPLRQTDSISAADE